MLKNSLRNDWFLIILLVALFGVGLTALYSAGGEERFLIQLRRGIIGILLMLALQLPPPAMAEARRRSRLLLHLPHAHRRPLCRRKNQQRPPLARPRLSHPTLGAHENPAAHRTRLRLHPIKRPPLVAPSRRPRGGQSAHPAGPKTTRLRHLGTDSPRRLLHRLLCPASAGHG